jgi:hypothetical protein
MHGMKLGLFRSGNLRAGLIRREENEQMIAVLDTINENLILAVRPTINSGPSTTVYAAQPKYATLHCRLSTLTVSLRESWLAPDAPPATFDLPNCHRQVSRSNVSIWVGFMATISPI